MISYIINILCFLIIFNISYNQNNQINKSKLYNINGIKYISAIEYAKSQNVRTIFYENKEKLEFRFQNIKLVISPHSSFIKLNDSILHMYCPVIYDGNDFFIPVDPFLEILKQSKLPIILIDSSEDFIITTPTNFNINSLEINNKINGIEINLNTSRKFSTDALAASISRAGWLNLTIAGATIDSIGIAESDFKSPIMRIRTIQSKESAQISFLLKSKVDDFEIESNNNFISIFLRTAMAENADKIKEMRKRWLLDTIVIDAGHGGKDVGCIARTGIQEKTVNLDIAKKLGKLIRENMGIKVIYTRDEDVFIPLWKRTQIANDAGGKVFISIHANSAPNNTSVRGFETYLLRPGKTQDAIDVAQRENEVIALEELYHKYEELSNDKLILYTMAQSAFMKQSEFLAFEIQKELDKVLTSPNRGVKQAGFHVLVGASMPNVLIETGFLSNKSEAKLLGQSRYRNKISQAIFSALVNFKDKYENPIISE
tara:strand:- start:1052 stop:2509 length:1458 start_codon:yes stop_codon:yes gene_type:complete